MPVYSPTDDRSLSRQARATLRRFGAQLSGRERGRDREVHRDSYDVHDPRAQVSRVLADGTEGGTLAWIDCLVRTAREYDVHARQKGGVRPLRASGIAVLDAVLRHHWHEYRTGKIDPALSQIEKATGYVRQTVVDALARLRRHGFLDRVRRTERVVNPEPGEPTRRQTNNLYLVDLAQLALKAGRNVLQRFEQFWNRAKARLAGAAKRTAPTPGPAKPAPARTVRDVGVSAALADLFAAGERTAAWVGSPSPESGLSPRSGIKR